jgi:hypothetical protein
MNILLPSEIDINDLNTTKVDFYKKSQDLVFKLKLLKRTQYL